MSTFKLEMSDVLNHLIQTTGISEAALGRKIGVPRATINRLVSGKTPDPRASTLEAIAQFFEITIDQLLGKQPLSNTSLQHRPSTKVDHWIPIIEWDQADQWQKVIHTAEPTNAPMDWILTDPNTEGGCFAMILKGESMSPQFYENSVLIVDTKKMAQNRDFIIVRHHDKQDILFRQLIIDGSYHFLKPINDMFPTLECNTFDTIIGVVVQSRNKLG